MLLIPIIFIGSLALILPASAETHKRIVIHVPLKVHHKDHIHTVYKHVHHKPKEHHVHHKTVEHVYPKERYHHKHDNHYNYHDNEGFEGSGRTRGRGGYRGNRKESSEIGYSYGGETGPSGWRGREKGEEGSWENESYRWSRPNRKEWQGERGEEDGGLYKKETIKWPGGESKETYYGWHHDKKHHKHHHHHHHHEEKHERGHGQEYEAQEKHHNKHHEEPKKIESAEEEDQKPAGLEISKVIRKTVYEDK